MATPDYSSMARARDLQNELATRCARFGTPLPVTAGQDASGNPLVIVGTVSAPGGAGFTIRLRPIDWPLVQTAVGIAQPVYSPHVTEIAYEAGIAADTVEAITTIAMACAKRGTRIAIYQSSNGTAADYTQMIPTKLVCTYLPDFTGMNASV